MKKSLRRTTPRHHNSNSNEGMSGLSPASSSSPMAFSSSSSTSPQNLPSSASTVSVSSSASCMNNIPPLSFFLFIFTAYGFLYSMYRDTAVASQIFIGNVPITQTQPDTHLRHIIPEGRIAADTNTSIYEIPLPSTLASPHAIPVLKPSLGMHRPHQDAIFIIGDGLQLSDFVLFIITLRNTGFDGDVVISTWNKKYLDEEIWKFLEYHSNAGIVVYAGVIVADKEPQSDDEDPLEVQNIRIHEMNHTKVWLHGLYGNKKQNKSDNENYDGHSYGDENLIYLDPRVSRSLGIARFELYWVWSLNYNPQSRILLIDAKDTYFQPFSQIGIGVGINCEESEPVELNMYEENNKVVKLGSIQNRARLIDAYKDKRIMWFLHNQNVLTPASTHGPQRAIEAYLRAMVQQFDQTGCIIYQCEWAFHNYIYYFGILNGMKEIDSVKTHMQGTGAVNSIGYNVPLNSVNQTKVFDADTISVYNRQMGYGKFQSWAVHQYDRDPQLNEVVEDLKDYLLTVALNYSEPFESAVFFFTNVPNDDQDVILSKPVMGTHRHNVDAIFSFVSGGFEDLVFFILSARKSGFDGDIVLNIPERHSLQDKEVIKFLEYHSKRGVIVYEGYDISFSQGTYEFKLNGDYIEEEIAKFEYFYIWSHHYVSNQIMILNGEYSYFQSNPFNDSSDCSRTALNFYVENKYSMSFQYMDVDNKGIWNKMKTVFNMSTAKLKNELRNRGVINPTSFYGHQHLLKQYLFSLVDLFNSTECFEPGCDYACVNFMWHKEIFEIGSPISVSLMSHQQGFHVINPGLAASKHFLVKYKLFDPESEVFLNSDGKPSPVVLNYHLNKELASIFNKRYADLLVEFPYK